MAIQGTLIQPYKLDIPPSEVSYVPNKFYYTPSALGFLILCDAVSEIVGVALPYTITGAVHPEGSYLEPTIGQIWPR